MDKSNNKVFSYQLWATLSLGASVFLFFDNKIIAYLGLSPATRIITAFLLFVLSISLYVFYYKMPDMQKYFNQANHFSKNGEKPKVVYDKDEKEYIITKVPVGMSLEDFQKEKAALELYLEKKLDVWLDTKDYKIKFKETTASSIKIPDAHSLE